MFVLLLAVIVAIIVAARFLPDGPLSDAVPAGWYPVPKLRRTQWYWDCLAREGGYLLRLATQHRMDHWPQLRGLLALLAASLRALACLNKAVELLPWKVSSCFVHYHLLVQLMRDDLPSVAKSQLACAPWDTRRSGGP